MMNKLLTRIALSAFVLGGIASPALADNSAQPTAAVASNSIWSKIPGLSSEQIKKINKERISFSKEAAEMTAAIKQKQAEIQQQLGAVKTNPSYLQQLMSEKIALESKLKQASLTHFIAVKKILTPQQIAVLNREIKKLSTK